MIQNYKIKGKSEGSIPWEQPPASASASVEWSPYREQPEKSTASRLGHFPLQPQSSPNPEASCLPAPDEEQCLRVWEDTLSKDGPCPQEWGLSTRLFHPQVGMTLGSAPKAQCRLTSWLLKSI